MTTSTTNTAIAGMKAARTHPALNMPETTDSSPCLSADCFRPVDGTGLFASKRATHPPRIWLQYGSLRQRSLSRLLAEEAARLLRRFNTKTHLVTPSGLPLPDGAADTHPKVAEL